MRIFNPLFSCRQFCNASASEDVKDTVHFRKARSAKHKPVRKFLQPELNISQLRSDNLKDKRKGVPDKQKIHSINGNLYYADHIPKGAKHFKSKNTGFYYQFERGTTIDACKKFDKTLEAHPNFHILRQMVPSDVVITFSDIEKNCIFAETDAKGITFYKGALNDEKFSFAVKSMFHEAGHIFAKKEFGTMLPVSDEDYHDVVQRGYISNEQQKTCIEGIKERNQGTSLQKTQSNPGAFVHYGVEFETKLNIKVKATIKKIGERILLASTQRTRLAKIAEYRNKSAEYRQALVADKHPMLTVYGNMDSAEDFAESINYALMTTDPEAHEAFKKVNPHRYEAIAKFVQKYGEIRYPNT